MAGASTITQTTDGGITVLTRPVIIRMTTGAVRCISRIRPSVGRTLRLTLMATTAANGAAVINVVNTAMHEIRWSPSIGRMAIITRGRSHGVITWFTGRNTTVMASRTSSRCYTVVAEVCRCPAISRVAGIAGFGGW